MLRNRTAPAAVKLASRRVTAGLITLDRSLEALTPTRPYSTEWGLSCALIRALNTSHDQVAEYCAGPEGTAGPNPVSAHGETRVFDHLASRVSPTLHNRFLAGGSGMLLLNPRADNDSHGEGIHARSNALVLAGQRGRRLSGGHGRAGRRLYEPLPGSHRTRR